MVFFERQNLDNNQEEGDPYDDWRIYAVEGNEYGINPYEYDSRDEYLQAVIDSIINTEIRIDEPEDDVMYGESRLCTDRGNDKNDNHKDKYPKTTLESIINTEIRVDNETNDDWLLHVENDDETL